jgi:4-diphosphocytidyl-2-C-methyl-D-erythritol kinase
MNLAASSPGKINLFLDVTGKRDTGYHDILTLFLPVSGIEDNITITPAKTLSISCEHPTVPEDDSNLCWKAAQLFAIEASISPNWQIHIEKKLPVAGGMGGGSSNAGTVLNLLNKHFSNKVSKQRLAEIALSIGADVPFFLNPVPSLAAGVGESLKVLATKEKIPMLIVTFDFPISAAWAYKNRALSFASSNISEEILIQKWNDSKFFEITYNDLGVAIRKKFPLLELTCGDLLEFGAKSAEISGSGPSIFALFESDADRDSCIQKMLDNEVPAKNLFACYAG